MIVAVFFMLKLHIPIETGQKMRLLGKKINKEVGLP